MKKSISLILALVLTLTVALAGCGSQSKSGGEGDGEEQTEPKGSFEDAEDIAYVLIYNPGMYDETKRTNAKLASGDFGMQIDVDAKRAEEGDYVGILNTLPQNQYTLPLADEDYEMDRADDFFTPYKTGDVVEFSYIDPGSGEGEMLEYECVMAGEKTNIWAPVESGYITEKQAKKMIEKFENDILETDVELFGEPRFADNGHKINIMIDETSNSAIMGWFITLELFSKRDGKLLKAVQNEYPEYTFNQDHAMLHVNRLMVEKSSSEEALYSTLAHEFQHLICQSEFFESGGKFSAATWINEAMSGYVEEYIFPGIQKKGGRYTDLAKSDLIRHGQSLYNFDVSTSARSFDIGVYGSVFLFSEYLAEIAGGDVFHNIHDNWKSADKKTTNAKAIRDAFSKDAQKKINKVIDYPEDYLDLDEDETWLSKLTLDFYLTLLAKGKNSPKAFDSLKAQTLLYDELDGTKIEGGGRVIVATADGTFEIPDDADEGLVYIGLDKDFNVITDPYFS